MPLASRVKLGAYEILGPIGAGGWARRTGPARAASGTNSHEKDIVHRDLKPSNVKVTPKGKGIGLWSR